MQKVYLRNHSNNESKLVLAGVSHPIFIELTLKIFFYCIVSMNYVLRVFFFLYSFSPLKVACVAGHVASGNVSIAVPELLYTANNDFI